MKAGLAMGTLFGLMLSLVLFLVYRDTTAPAESSTLDNEHVFLTTLTANQRVAYKDKSRGVFCTEPSPDATLDSRLAKTFAGDTEGTAAGTSGLRAELDAQHSMGQLYRRSQSIQFLRDGMFYTCLAFLNGALTENEYAKLQKDLIERSFVLLEIELRASVSQQVASTGAQRRQGRD